MIKMTDLKCKICGKNLVSTVRDPEEECLLLPNNISQCYNKQGLTLEESLSIFTQITSHQVTMFIEKMEKLKNPLASMGMYGVKSAKEHWKLNALIPKLQCIKENFDEIKEKLSEK